jgi:hypothetical protein
MDTPRLLTPEEIESILDRALPTPGKPRTGDQAYVISIIDPAVAKTAYQNTRRLLRQQLKRERISPAAIDALVNVIARRLTQAQVPAGDNVGGKCGEAMAAPVTQMTLNTFHQSGSGKDVGGGIDGLRALLNMNETRYPQCFIHFKNKKLSERAIVDLRKDYVALPMSNLLKDYDIGMAETETELFLPTEYGDDLWWVRSYQELHPELLNSVSPWYLRVELNTALMVEYAITPEHIRRTLQTNVIKVVPSPMRLGVVYLFVQSDSIPTSFKEDKGENPRGDSVDIVILYLQSVVVPSFQDIAFRGIPGISRMVPALSKTTKIVAEEIPVYSTAEIEAAPAEERDRMQRMWRVLLHAGRIKTSGVTASYLAELFQKGGFQTDIQDSLTLVVVVPTGSPTRLPSVLINTMVSEEQKATEDRRKQALVEAKERKQRVQKIQDGPLVQASQYTYGHAFGSGFLRALMHPDVDSYFTYSNEISTTYELFGIEAARNLWILLFTQAMEKADDTSTDPRHLIMAADILFNQGRPLGITYRGISRQKGSTLAMITVEKAMEGISKVAAVGGLDNTTAASAAIMVGRRGEWGTGYALDLLPDPEAEKKALDALRSAKAVVPVEELQAALEETEDIPLTEDDLFRQVSAAAPPPLQPPAPAPKAPTMASAPLPPSVQQLLRPAHVVSPALLNASTHVAAAPSLPQGVEALVVVTKQARRVLPRFVPPKVALVLSDTSGSTSAPWEAGMPVPDFIPLSMPVPGAPVKPTPLRPTAPAPSPAPARLPSGLPAPIDASAWILFSRG